MTSSVLVTKSILLSSDATLSGVMNDVTNDVSTLERDGASCVPENIKCCLTTSMNDSSNGRGVALYPADPGSNPRSGSV